jgi:alkyl hydroperoxide reductase subunit AhpC
VFVDQNDPDYFHRVLLIDFKLPLSRETNMSLRINDQAPNFIANTTQGEINFHDWIGDSWAVLFSHPKNFTPVCTTELGYMASIQSEFTERNTKIVAISIDPVEDHLAWSKDVEEVGQSAVDYPIIADTDLNVAKLYSMFPADENEDAEDRTAMTNATVRSVFIIGPDKNVKLMMTYPMTTGRNFTEILRVLDSMQLTAKHKVATPVNWQQGDDVIIVPGVNNEEAAKVYPEGWETVKSYLRKVKQPG